MCGSTLVWMDPPNLYMLSWLAIFWLSGSFVNSHKLQKRRIYSQSRHVQIDFDFVDFHSNLYAIYFKNINIHDEKLTVSS
jgi:hypothetical protein